MTVSSVRDTLRGRGIAGHSTAGGVACRSAGEATDEQPQAARQSATARERAFDPAGSATLRDRPGLHQELVLVQLRLEMLDAGRAEESSFHGLTRSDGPAGLVVDPGPRVGTAEDGGEIEGDDDEDDDRELHGTSLL
jgi:hypothetical protein